MTWRRRRSGSRRRGRLRRAGRAGAVRLRLRVRRARGRPPGCPAAGPRAGTGAGRRPGTQRARRGPRTRRAACPRRRRAPGPRAGAGWWLHRFQYVYNALMAGNLDKAAEGFGRLPEPQDAAWTLAREKVRRMLARASTARASTARAVTSLDSRDLRGWHSVLAGVVRESLSPYGFNAGMTGRWAYLNDPVAGCAAAL